MSQPRSDAQPPARLAARTASLGRRVVALVIDWGLCLAISAGFFRFNAWATLAVFAVENLLLVSTLGYTIGHRLLGLRVRPLDVDAAPGFIRGGLRTILLCVVVPAVVWDSDGRGLHDRLAGTVITRIAPARPAA